MSARPGICKVSLHNQGVDRPGERFTSPVTIATDEVFNCTGQPRPQRGTQHRRCAAPSDRCGGGRRWPPPPPPCPATPPPGTPAAGIPGRRAVPAGPVRDRAREIHEAVRQRQFTRAGTGRRGRGAHQAPHRPAHTGRPKLVPTFRGSARAQQKVKGVPVGVGSGRTTARRGYGSADGSGVDLSGNVRRERGRPSVRPASARTVDGAAPGRPGGRGGLRGGAPPPRRHISGSGHTAGSSCRPRAPPRRLAAPDRGAPGPRRHPARSTPPRP